MVLNSLSFALNQLPVGGKFFLKKSLALLPEGEYQHGYPRTTDCLSILSLPGRCLTSFLTRDKLAVRRFNIVHVSLARPLDLSSGQPQ